MVFLKFREIDKVNYWPIIGKKIFPQYNHEHKINVRVTVLQNTFCCVIKMRQKNINVEFATATEPIANHNSL